MTQVITKTDPLQIYSLVQDLVSGKDAPEKIRKPKYSVGLFDNERIIIQIDMTCAKINSSIEFEFGKNESCESSYLKKLKINNSKESLEKIGNLVGSYEAWLVTVKSDKFSSNLGINGRPDGKVAFNSTPSASYPTPTVLSPYSFDDLTLILKDLKRMYNLADFFVSKLKQYKLTFDQK